VLHHTRLCCQERLCEPNARPGAPHGHAVCRKILPYSARVELTPSRVKGAIRGFGRGGRIS